MCFSLYLVLNGEFFHSKTLSDNQDLYHSCASHPGNQGTMVIMVAENDGYHGN